MTEQKSRTYAYLRVTGYAPASEITRRLQLDPTREASIGEERPRGLGPRPFTIWERRISRTDYEPLSQQVEYLVAHLANRSEQIRTLPPDFSPSIVCVAYYAEYQTGGFGLSLNTIQAMAYLGLSLDFDIYSEGPSSAESSKD